MTQSAYRRLACATVSLALAAIAAATPQTAGAVTISHFQQTKNVSCGGGSNCIAHFIDLPANQALNVDHVWCEIITEGILGRGSIYAVPAVPVFQIPLGLLWQRTYGTNRIYSLGTELNMRVPLGKQLVVAIDISGGSPHGYCSFTGERIIQ